jgi:hypothetical protein
MHHFTSEAARISQKVVTLAVVIGFSFPTVTFGAKDSPISPQEICKRLQITEELLVFDSTGTHPVDAYRKVREAGGLDDGQSGKNSKTPEIVCRKSSHSGNSSSSFDGPIFFMHEWIVKTDGTISVNFEQGGEFQGRGREATLAGSTGKHSQLVKDFEPISWVSSLHKNQRVLVRLTPSLIDGERSRELGKFPLILDHATVYDGKGRLWTVNLTADGDFIGVVTMQGSVVLSYQSFSGGKKIGRVSGREIRFKIEDGTSVVFKSESMILPGEMASDIYVLFDPSQRAASIGSQSVSSGSSAEETIQKLGRHRD